MLSLDFAKPNLTEVMKSTQAGQKGVSGLAVRSNFFVEDGNLIIGLEVTNASNSAVTEFDIMFNKNPFAVYISGQANKF